MVRSPFRRFSQAFAAAVCCCYAADDSARLIEKARKAEAAGNKVQAYIFYQRAAAEKPSDPELWAKMRSLSKAVMPASVTLTPFEPVPAPEIKLPGLEGQITTREVEEAERKLEGPPVLTAAKPLRKSFHVRGDVKKLFEDLAQDYGLVAIFERELMSQPPASQPIRFDIDDTDYRTAIHALSRTTNTFATPISDRIFLVAQDTTQKRQEYEQTVARVFAIPQRTSVQEAQELSQAIQQTLEIRRITVDPQKRQILIRDRRSKVDLAALLLEEMEQYKPQVEVELELLTTGKTTSRNLGMSLPNSSALVSFGKVRDHITFWPSTFLRFLSFGGGTTFMGLALGDAQLLANYTRSESKSVLRSSLVASDGQAATLHIGDKYPIVTSQFVGATPKPGENVVAPPPAFNFEELGLVLKVTPFVHGTDEVTLEIEAEFKTLGSGGFNGIPVINTRKFQSKVRLRTVDWAVVAGLVSESDARTLSGIAGLADIPILGKALSSNGKDVSKSEALILLKPRILSLPPSERATRRYWFGSETKPLSPL